jgi:uncharacterized protein
MRTKFTLLSIVMLLAVVLSACVAAPAASTQQPPVRSLNVSGSAQTVLTPDIAYISIGVHTDSKDASEAVTKNNTMTQSVIDAIMTLSVDPKDIRTTNFSIYPQQQYDNNGVMTGTLFVVDNTVYVTMRDLTKIGDILGAAVSSGANNINGIQFDVADKSQALTDARAQAVADARKQADELAKAAGVTLGPIQSISFYNNYPTPVLMDSKAVGGGGASAVPVSAGQLTITVDVNVVYEIK